MSVKCEEILWFFENLVPRRLAEQRALAQTVRCSVCFIVHEAGAWTIELGNSPEGGMVRPGINLGADTIVGFDVAGFCAFLSGENHKPPMLVGSAQGLSRLGQVLNQEKMNGLALRMVG